MAQFIGIIKEIGKKHGIKVEAISEDWVIVLTKENVVRYMVGYKFDLNSQGTAAVCDDKYALYDVLQRRKIPVITHHLFFQGDYEKLEKTYKEQGENVVLKSNTGSCGKEVFHVDHRVEKLKETYEMLAGDNRTFSLCPFYEIQKEYRFIYLNGILHSYQKQNPVVIGNGTDTLKTLLQQFNPVYYSNEENFLEEVDLDQIPKAGEKIVYEWRFNLEKGSIIEPIPEQKKTKLEELASLAAKEINLKFGSIDMIETKQGETLIMEINSGIMMKHLQEQLPDGEQIAYGIYEKAILEMFKNE